MAGKDKNNTRRRLYVNQFLAGPRGTRGNSRKAAIAAGYHDGPYLDDRIKEIHKDPQVQEWLKAHYTRWDLTEERILAEYCRIAFANLADIGDFNAETGEFEVHQRNLELLGPEVTAAIAEIKPVVDQQGNVRYGIKLHDKKAALDFLAKFRGLIRTADVNITLIQMMTNLNLGVFSTEELHQFRSMLARALPPAASNVPHGAVPPPAEALPPSPPTNGHHPNGGAP